MADDQTRKQKIARVIARAWADDEFMTRLKQNPRDALAEHDIAVPEGTTLHVLENDSSTTHFVLPAKPKGPIVDDEAQQRLAMLETGNDCYTYCAHICFQE